MIRLSQHSSNLQASSWRKAVRGVVVCLGVVVVLLGSGKVWGQVASYTYATSAGTYTAITGTTWLSGAAVGTDAVSSAINLPWTFKYNGKNYTQLFISNNGFVTFGSATEATVYLPISNTSNSTTVTNAYDGALSPFGTNLVHSTVAGSAPTIIYGTSGSDFVNQFTDVARTGQGGV
ncbi:MAG: hypothetical protein ACK45H_14575 [Bacteroidota bacterium]